jgi:phosphoglycerate dehydrogenase-like enzyme
MLIPGCSKFLIRTDRSLRDSYWDWHNGLEAAEAARKRLLILGYGPTGLHLVRLAEGSAM